MRIDAATLRRLWPRAPQPLVDAIATHGGSVFAKYGLTTPLRLAHFMAQISHESGGGTVTAENLSYSSAARIAAVWPRRFTAASAVPYVHNPQGLADRVYNGRMGNTPGSDDGFNYRGRGLLQLTGRDSYRAIGSAVGLPLEAQPELAAAPSVALEIAAVEFKKLGCLPFCDADNIEAVTRRVNGGYIGLPDRKAWLAKWKPVLPADAAAAPENAPSVAVDAPEGPEYAPAPVDIPRGSDERLPPGVDHPGKTMTQDRSTWATIVAGISTVGTMLGGAVESLKPLLTDPRTIGVAVAIAIVAWLVILYESRARLRSDHV